MPRTSSPPRYNYLGADELPTELASGVVNMGARTYVPALGRFEQTDPQPGGSGNAYTYTHNDPVNQADPSGEWTNTVSYDYEAAETGASQGLAETYTGPGAILPPPVNAQIEAEFVADPPWSAATVFEADAEGSIGTLYDPVKDMMQRDKSIAGREWEEAGSRCQQYGGHWQGRTCVGIPVHGGGINITCGDIGSAVGGVVGTAFFGALTAGNPYGAAGEVLSVDTRVTARER